MSPSSADQCSAVIDLNREVREGGKEMRMLRGRRKVFCDSLLISPFGIDVMPIGSPLLNRSSGRFLVRL